MPKFKRKFTLTKVEFEDIIDDNGKPFVFELRVPQGTEYFALQRKIQPYTAAIDKIKKSEDLSKDEEKGILTGFAEIISQYSNVDSKDIYDPESDTGLGLTEIVALLAPLNEGKDPKVTRA